VEDRIKIDDRITVGGQPGEEQLGDLARQGFKSVINLRTAGEPEQPLSPDQEGEKVRALGLEYRHIPVSTKDMRPEQVDEFRREVEGLPGPDFVHCHEGKRAGAFAMMHTAAQAGATGEQTLRQAEAMGFRCDTPQLKEFVSGYTDRSRSSRAMGSTLDGNRPRRHTKQ
jgi:uncharacterized protein (TIGR01244 family)